MGNEGYRCLLVSDFNINNLAGYLRNDLNSCFSQVIVAPFGQVVQLLIDRDSESWQSRPDSAVVWTQPENVIGSFKRMLDYQSVSTDKLLREVDEYSSLLLGISDRVKFAFVPTWVLPSYHRGLGMLDMKADIGVSHALLRMNLRLSENLSKASSFYLLNTQRWVNTAGKNAFSPKLWYLGKIPFGNEVFRQASKDISSAWAGITGNSKKVILLDLDDTLWGGIVGDVGWQNITLGGHHPVGEAYVDFQLGLKSLTNRGILLAIVSKNDEATALETINRHPEMVLRLNDFAGWKINWEDKAANIADLMGELNLGLQSAVFVDDSPAERARVREALPEVFVPEWPEDKMLYKSTLLDLDCFDTSSITQEDLKRREHYVSEQRRRACKVVSQSVEEWLKSLRMKVVGEELNEANLPRAVQLLNKTNQMNLSTRRMTESELVEWVRAPNRKMWTFRVSDNFGDSGLTGLVSLEWNNHVAKVVDFILSCRVVGRKLEETMLWTATKYARSKGLREMRATYIPTGKNQLCLDFWKRTGFCHDESANVFNWKIESDCRIPEDIQIEGDVL